jgi:hypothetical protein
MSKINTAWVNQLTNQINSVPDCTTLALLLTKIQAELNAQIQDAVNQIAYLESLIVIPTDLASVINWIKKIIAGYNAQYLAAIQMEVELVAALSQLLTAINNKAANLQCNNINVSTIVTVPSVNITIPTPPIT